jgi:hypothetical protein
MGRSLSLSLLLILFGGCGAPNTMTDGLGNALDAGSPDRPAIAKSDDTKCRELGLTSGTPEYGDCRLRLKQTRAAQAPAPENDLGL